MAEQTKIIDELCSIFNDDYDHLGGKATMDSPDMKATGRLILQVFRFPRLTSEDKESLAKKVNKIISSFNDRTGLRFSCEWRRGRA